MVISTHHNCTLFEVLASRVWLQNIILETFRLNQMLMGKDKYRRDVRGYTHRPQARVLLAIELSWSLKQGLQFLLTAERSRRQKQRGKARNQRLCDKKNSPHIFLPHTSFSRVSSLPPLSWLCSHKRDETLEKQTSPLSSNLALGPPSFVLSVASPSADKKILKYMQRSVRMHPFTVTCDKVRIYTHIYIHIHIYICTCI